MHVALLRVTYSLRLALRSVMARGLLYLVGDITAKCYMQMNMMQRFSFVVISFLSN